MARIRTIKPEFWTSEQIMECSTNARLLFVGLWNFCDDAGRMTFSAKKVKAQIFPSDDFSHENILGMINELSENGLIFLYEVENIQYLAVTGWHHQRIDKPQKSKIPPPSPEHSTNIPRTFDVGMEWKGKEGNKKECSKEEHSRPNRTPKDSPEFVAWWQAYPRREAKGQARKAYAKARKKASPEILLGSAQHAAKLHAGTERQFIPLPATWLNGERWLDESAQQPNAKPIDWRSVL